MDKKHEPIPWHRLLGLALADYFQGTCFEVEVERDLSRKRQILDVVIVKRHPGLPMPDRPMMAGFEDLGEHNLLTFKSGTDTLNAFAIMELVGHYVNYCKILKRRRMIDHETDRLFAVSMRFPKGLARDVQLERLRPGLYQTWVLGTRIYVIVTREIPKSEQDALWNLFGLSLDAVLYGKQHYHWQSENQILIIKELFERYKLEGIDMYTFEDLKRDSLNRFTPEERMAGLKPEERIAGLRPEERIAGLRPEERIAGLKPEERIAGLKPEERIAGLRPEERIAGLRPEDILNVLGEEAVLENIKPERLAKSLRAEDMLNVLGEEVVLKIINPEMIKAYMRQMEDND